MQVPRLTWSQGPHLPSWVGDGQGVADGAVAGGPVPQCVAAQAGQRPAGGPGWLGTVADPDLPESAVDQGRGQFTQPQVAEGRLHVQACRCRVQLTGAGSQAARVEVGQPQRDHLAHPGTGSPLPGREGRPLVQRGH